MMDKIIFLILGALMALILGMIVMMIPPGVVTQPK